jgi:D-sedoheptulose 7-phosphate isomerase
MAEPAVKGRTMPFATDYLDELKRALDGLDPDRITTAISWLKGARDSGRFIYVCGNGGSASIASQMVVDLVKGASYERQRRFKVMALNDSIANITAYANDVGYESVFVEQLRNFAVEGDVLIAISGSGNSPNVLRAVDYANSIGCRTIALTKSGGGSLRDMASLTLGVPADHMGRLEDCFFVMSHILMYAFMDRVVE